jgi:Pyridoxamine 5'-phosphate oxidase
MAGAAFDATAFLNEAGRSAQVASVSQSAQPLLGSLWFLFDRQRFWFSSAKAGVLPQAAMRGTPIAVIVDDFDPPRNIRQVRIRGRGQIEPHDPAVVRRIYERYLGSDDEEWPLLFRSLVYQSDDWVLWSVYPDTGLALIAPDFVEKAYRWTDIGHSPFV